MKATTLRHEFVEFIPTTIEEGILYISIPYTTVAHRCCCGCGNEVITPLGPTDWTLIFDGESVSLEPSIGSWNLRCNSHYWIRNDRVEWAPAWSKKRITAARTRDREAKDQLFSKAATTRDDQLSNAKDKEKPRPRWWRRLIKQ